ncbi:MAG: GNAT family N-acetyltransferase [Flavobacteriaceae bacterium]
MEFIIRQGEIKDMGSVIELIQELAAFEKEPDAVEIDMYDLIKEGFTPNPSFKSFVAEMNDEIVGMALFYQRFSTWKGKSIHLEDLIVQKNKRGLGIGKALYREFLQYAYNQKAKRVEWVVLNWNTDAIAFYEKSGASVLTDWRTVQMNEKSLENFIKNI